MTNGEKLEQVFPDGICPFSKRGLDHEYKEPSTKINQDLTKNKSEIPTGSIIDWNNCHTSEQLANISTAKNDLGVDKTFYEQIMEYCNEHFLVLVEKDVWEDARKALTTKNDLAVDCVSRQFMLDLGATCIATRNKNGDLIALGAIEQLPPATPIRPKGHWIRVSKDKLRCSECDVIHFIAQYPLGQIAWCPNCGAEMNEVEE